MSQHFQSIEYTLNTAVDPTDSGTISVNPVKPNYYYGDVVTLTAHPNDGYNFSNWTGDATGTANPVSVTITKNTSVTANFTYIEYTLTTSINPTNTGQIKVDPLKSTYHYGDVVTLTAGPKAGYSFAYWSGDAAGTANPISIMITKDTSVTANFTQIEYTLTTTVNPTGSGTVTVSPVKSTYHYGDIVTLTGYS